MIEDLIPHGVCLATEPLVVVALIFADLIIAIVYFAIPIRLWILLGHIKGRSLVFSPVLKLFAWFIFGCGMTHVAAIVTMFLGGYFYIAQVCILLLTSVVSIAALVALISAHEIGYKLVSVFVDRSSGEKRKLIISDPTERKHDYD